MKIFIETKRLILKTYTLSDLQDWILLRQDPIVMKYIGNVKTKEEIESFFFEIVAPYHAKHEIGFCSVFEKKSGLLIGQAGLFHVGYDDTQTDIEVAYRLFEKFWGKGYATELASALIEWGFAHLSVNKFIGFAWKGNVASSQVLKKIGMHYVEKQINDTHNEILCYEIERNTYYSGQGKRYDLIATGFADMRDAFYTEQKYLDEMIKHIPQKAHILDVGCGSGFPIAAYLIEQGFEVTGIDGSQKLLEIAKEKCPKMKRILGDVRTVQLDETFDAIVEWWCLFHVPKYDHEKMIHRFSQWLKADGIVEFTTGDSEYENASSDMLNQELHFYSLDPKVYEQYLKKYGFKILLKESDQETHMVWIAKKTSY